MDPENVDLTAEQGGAPDETPDKPDWLDSRYESVEDQAKAYSEAQRKIEEQGRELGRLRPLEERLDEMQELLTQQQAPQSQQFDPMSHPLIAGAQQALDNGDVVGLMAAMQQLIQAPQAETRNPGVGITEFTAGQVRDTIASRYGADEEMQAEAYRIMESDPFVSQQLTQVLTNDNATVDDLVPVVDIAYRLASQGAAAKEQQSLAQQQAETERARQRKLEQESLTPAGTTRTTTPDERKETWEGILNADVGGLPRVQAS